MRGGSFNGSQRREGAKDLNCFSFFKAPITNIRPYKTLGLREVYELITGGLYKDVTMRLREISDPKQARLFKAQHFDYCTFSGVFSYRNAQSLITPSGLMVVDFDHVQYLNDLYAKLLYDEYFETQLLFRSPSGNGLKWVIKFNYDKAPHQKYFNAVANYIKGRHGIEVDRSGSDVARACFLCYDAAAYINPDLKHANTSTLLSTGDAD
jgi:hypothetical protein